MKAAAMAFVMAGALACPGLAKTEVQWKPAHALTPDGDLTGLAYGDLDGDGDYDLSAVALGPVGHYWNVGGPQVPAWELDMGVFSGIPSCVERRGDLGDVDSDNDLDLLLGCYYTDFLLCWNTGTPQQPEWQYDPAVFESVEVWQGGTNPVFVDLDGDGDLDMVAVTPSIPPRAGENTGTPGAYEFSENPDLLLGVDQPADGGWGVVLLDIDADDDLDLLFAGWSSQNYLYLNEGPTPVEPLTWTRVKAMYRR